MGLSDLLKRFNRRFERTAVAASAQNVNPTQSNAAGAVAAGIAETQIEEQEQAEQDPLDRERS